MRTQLISALVFAATTITSCNGQKVDSRADAIDNFARQQGAAVRTYDCAGNYDVVDGLNASGDGLVFAQGADTPELRASLNSALRSVPTNLQLAFFGLSMHTI